jgi:hypothetical protein
MSSLAKNYLIYHLIHIIFNFLLNYLLLFPQQHIELSTSIFIEPLYKQNKKHKGDKENYEKH